MHRKMSLAYLKIMFTKTFNGHRLSAIGKSLKEFNEAMELDQIVETNVEGKKIQGSRRMKRMLRRE